MTGIDDTGTRSCTEVRRPTERQGPCPGCHPDQPDLRCVIPDGHVVHWDGQRDIWLSPTVADDLALAAAESRGWDKAVAALREAHFVAGDSYAEYLDNVKAEVLGGETT